MCTSDDDYTVIRNADADVLLVLLLLLLCSTHGSNM